MAIKLYFSAILSILVGLLIIIAPGLIRWTIGLYLIAMGILSFIDF